MRKLYLLAFVRVRAFFGFSYSEANGFIVLMILMLIVGFFPFVFRFIPPKTNTQQEIADHKKLDSLVAILDQMESQPSKNANKTASIKKDPHLFVFDPNTATEKEFIELGLPNFLASRIVKYREKGGRFRKPADFAKIYGLRPTDYEKLLPYIQINDPEKQPDFQSKQAISPNPKSVFTFSKTNSLPAKTDINLADSIQFVRVRGIGAILASRIVKFRNKLGGFVSMEQIKEVYGLDSSVVGNIERQFFIAPEFSPTKLLINQADYKSLSAHPYIGGKLAGQILNYKKQHGNYHSLTDLEKIQTMDIAKLGKLMPYISFE